MSSITACASSTEPRAGPGPASTYGRALLLLGIFVGLLRWHPGYWHSISLLNSFFYGFGYALSLLLTGGGIDSVDMMGAGIQVNGHGGISVVTAAAGPLSATLAGGALMWIAARTNFDRPVALLLGGALLLLSAFCIRDRAGLMVGLGGGGLLFLGGWKMGGVYCDVLLSFLGMCSLFEIAFQGLSFLLPPGIQFARDMDLLARATPLSARTWTAIFAVLPVVTGLAVFRSAVGGGRPAPP